MRKILIISTLLFAAQFALAAPGACPAGTDCKALADSLRSEANQLNVLMLTLHSLEDRGADKNKARADFEVGLAKLVPKIKADRSAARSALAEQASAMEGEETSNPPRAVEHSRVFVMIRHLNELAKRLDSLK